MSPQHKIKHLILAKSAEWAGETIPQTLTPQEIEERYDTLVEDDGHWDAESELREGEVETGLPCEWSRHYESKSVAAKYVDGSWVGWTYWYGGGKHGEPEAIEWIEDAYDLTCAEEQKVVTVRTFAKASASETEGQDREAGLGAEHESAAPKEDAHE